MTAIIARYLTDFVISKNKEVMQVQGKYPVIWLSLKKVKADTWDVGLSLLCSCLVEMLDDHSYLKDHPDFAKAWQEQMTVLKADSPNEKKCHATLKLLIKWLAEYHGTEVVVLVDEYDTPVTNAWLSGYYREMVDFLKVLLGDALKDNRLVAKSVFTGVLRVSKESFFSDFNNFSAYSVLGENQFSDKIGFTPEEVQLLLRDHGMNGREWEEISNWYDGYRFGHTTIFNPWSILNYVQHPAQGLQPYWVNTSDNLLLMDLFFHSSERIKGTLESLIRREKIRVAVSEHFTYGDLRNNDEAVWNMLLLAGYLRSENPKQTEEEMSYDLSIPNREVLYIYKRIIKKWLYEQVVVHNELDWLLEYMLKGEMHHFERFLRDFALRVFSYHDTSGPHSENFYHAFLLGLFVRLEDRYQVRSNRESGLGRYDIALIPKDRRERGFVFEIKTPDAAYKETLRMALNRAKKQLQMRKYDTELAEAGVTHIVRIALAVQGKELLMKVAEG